MFNVPTYRIRAYVRGMRKNKTSTTRPTPKLPPVHYKRTFAEIALHNTENVLSLNGGQAQRYTVPANVVLNDITPRGVFLFTTEQIQVGQKISLTIHGPKRFFIRGRVVMCRRMSFHSATLSESSFPFRVGILFEFESIDERIAVKRYYDELAGNYLRSIEC